MPKETPGPDAREVRMVRVQLPHHLQTLARVPCEVALHVEGRPTLRSLLDALETSYPVLRGTIRDHTTQKRRPYVRFFACEQDFSHHVPEDRKSTRLNSSHLGISYAVFCLKKKNKTNI